MTEKRIALVAGASREIRKATAELLAKNNFYVFAMVPRMDRLEQIRCENIEPICLDVADADAISALVDYAIASKGRIDLLVNNAGWLVHRI